MGGEEPVHAGPAQLSRARDPRPLDAYSHFFSREYDLPLDVGKAIGYLEQGLAEAARSGRDRDVIEQRLAEPRHAVTVQRSR